MYEVNGKVALITGAASGIGLLIAKELLENGLKAVALTDVNDEVGQAALLNVKDEYGDQRAIFVKLDVTDRNQFQAAFNSTIEAFTHLDIVVNCAGVCMEKEWEKAIAINLTGTVTGTLLANEEFLPKHKTGNEAVILNISSVYGVRNFSNAPVYSASKWGILGLTRSLGTEVHYQRNKIKVMSLCPGFTQTPFHSQGWRSLLNEFYDDMIKNSFENTYCQDARSVSKAAVQVIREGKNGSIWIVEDDKAPYEIEIKDH